MNNKYKSIFLTGVSTILLLSGCCEANSNNNENDNDNVMLQIVKQMQYTQILL